jgi:hypothetical protein
MKPFLSPHSAAQDCYLGRAFSTKNDGHPFVHDHFISNWMMKEDPGEEQLRKRGGTKPFLDRFWCDSSSENARNVSNKAETGSERSKDGSSGFEARLGEFEFPPLVHRGRLMKTPFCLYCQPVPIPVPPYRRVYSIHCEDLGSCLPGLLRRLCVREAWWKLQVFASYSVVWWWE